MANAEQLDLIRQGARAWNRWRKRNPGVRPDLSGDEVSDFEVALRLLSDVVANEVMPGKFPSSEGGLGGLDLSNINLRTANLRRANLSRTTLILADLTGADLSYANLSGCILTSAKLRKANLSNTGLSGAILRFANLKDANLDSAILRLANLDQANATGATLRQTDLSFASITEANLTRADLSGSFVYGISAWNVELKGAKQTDLRITRTNEGTITVDDIKIAQFVYTILNNQHVRDMIETLTTKIVVILGRFTPERKAVLDGAKVWLRDHNYVPIIFDFDRPVSRDFTETVVTLAHMARFIIADLTEPASVAKELEAIVPRLAIPVQPLLQQDAPLYAMFNDYWKYDWVLKPQRYQDLPHLLRSFGRNIVAPAERKARELLERRSVALSQ